MPPTDAFLQLEQLVKLCSNSVTLYVNDHRDVYQTVEEYLNDERAPFLDQRILLNPFVRAGMIETDTIVCLQAYPHSAGGFNVIYHYSIAEAVRQMIELVEFQKGLGSG